MSWDKMITHWVLGPVLLHIAMLFKEVRVYRKRCIRLIIRQY